MKIHKVEAGSAEWLQLRAGLPTASEMKELVSPTGKIRTGEGPAKYFAKKLAEKWLGRPIETGKFSPMIQGNILEEHAIPWLEMSQDITIVRPGFITTDDGKSGCTPDGMDVGHTTGYEIKCCEPHTHCRYLIDGEVPDDYIIQVQHSLFVTGLRDWRFLSYCRRFPELLIVVDREPDIIAAIAEAIDGFSERMTKEYARLVEKNGGEPEHVPGEVDRFEEYYAEEVV